MAISVNLDALIPRADFDIVESTSQSAPPQTMQIRDLEKDAFFYSGLRKPDFQRETASWSPRKVKDFVKTFAEGDLIPAIILWRSQGSTFIIDGAHRLSALIAWVNDDYGDGSISRQFFTHIIAPEQVKVAEKTRKLINKEIGSYADHQFAIKHPEKIIAGSCKPGQAVRSSIRHLAVGNRQLRKSRSGFLQDQPRSCPN